jgi:hypothetical protein
MSPSKEAVRRSRRVFTPEQKATILRRHLGEKFPSRICVMSIGSRPGCSISDRSKALEHLTAAF